MTAYLRDPAAIYARSFATVRAEADLARIPRALHPAAIRMIHASGMPELAADIVGDPALPGAVRAALSRARPVLCDCAMVRAGLLEAALGASEALVTLNDPAVPGVAARLGTTRSAAAVELWRERLAGAVVVIGNAPTALHHLLDMLAGLPPEGRPAAIVATPVGFVGAAESKARLVAEASCAFLTVLGRRGGSAIAAAAFNALAGQEP